MGVGGYFLTCVHFLVIREEGEGGKRLLRSIGRRHMTSNSIIMPKVVQAIYIKLLGAVGFLHWTPVKQDHGSTATGTYSVCHCSVPHEAWLRHLPAAVTS